MDVSHRKVLAGVACATVMMVAAALFFQPSEPTGADGTIFAHYEGTYFIEGAYYGEVERFDEGVTRWSVPSLEGIVELFEPSRLVVAEAGVLQLTDVTGRGGVLLPSVNPHTFKPIRFVAKEGEGIESPEDLSGRKVAVDTDNAAGITAFAALEERHGITPEDVDIVEVSSSAKAGKLLVLESVDAAVIAGKRAADVPAAEIEVVVWRPLLYLEERFDGSLPLTVFAVSGQSDSYQRGLEVMEAVNASVSAGLRQLEERIRNASLVRGVRSDTNLSFRSPVKGLAEVSEEDMRFIQFLHDYAYEYGFTDTDVNVSQLYASIPDSEEGQ